MAVSTVLSFLVAPSIILMVDASLSIWSVSSPSGLTYIFQLSLRNIQLVRLALQIFSRGNCLITLVRLG